ncbi:MAG: response regulator, partial [Kineothrix sp.]|nr:response regulator [Kineothrix sp.]
MEKIKVIIAEDEPPIARFIKMLTEQEDDFLVTAICENGEDALKEVENSPARLLITDIRMLGMDGLELIRRIRQKNQEIKILIISGYKMFEYAREAIRLGIEDYITKPIEPEEFAEALDRVRRHYTREDRLERQFRLEKALKNKDGKAWVENVPGKLLEVMNIYQSGDANENIPF